MKQIRPTENNLHNLAKSNSKVELNTPRFADYLCGYLCWLLAFFLPGLHHFYLGNYWRGFKYLITINELCVGWFLDLFELHILIKKSVETYGNQTCCTFCGGSGCNGKYCCGC